MASKPKPLSARQRRKQLEKVQMLAAKIRDERCDGTEDFETKSRMFLEVMEEALGISIESVLSDAERRKRAND